MAWTVILTGDFLDWLQAEPERTRRRIAESLVVLETFGPALGRPQADTVKGSSLANLKELRVRVGGAPYRLFSAFDPIRQAVVLWGRDKTGDRRFYDRMIPLAEAAFAAHLRTLANPQPGDAP